MTSPQTRFGPVEFRVLAIDQGQDIVTGWNRESHYAIHHIPGSNDNITFLMGVGPGIVTYRVECSSIDVFRNLEAMKQGKDTLVLRTGINTETPTTEVDYFGDTYDHIDNAVLLDVQNSSPRRNGKVVADATFLVP